MLRSEQRERRCAPRSDRLPVQQRQPLTGAGIHDDHFALNAGQAARSVVRMDGDQLGDGQCAVGRRHGQQPAIGAERHDQARRRNRLCIADHAA